MPKVVPEYKEEARRKIIQHASILFSEKGYTKTKMTDIAESVGVSKGAIYQYFESKSNLLIAILESYTALREQQVRKFLDEKGLRFLATGEFFEYMLSMRKMNIQIGPGILQEIADNDAAMKWIRSGSEQWIQSIKDLIDGLVRKGAITTNVSSEYLARGILALRDGLYGSLSLGADVEKVTDTWIEIMGILLKHALN
ncbi:MAG: TetR/AcrR family transcriptional regulator [Candidatus Thorarchaeota archaeon]|nr:TetR/AcrR family transcriptional regulator [Candidatus Thorarchaeota archaeon]